jgi:hypothetical protein
MAEQLWGTYSVADHCTAYPFVADLVVYDRLLVPVPPDADEDEWQRWRDKGWEPDVQHSLLKELDDYVRRIPWSAELRGRWNAIGNAGDDVDREMTDSAVRAAGDLEMTAEGERHVRAGRADPYGDTRWLVSKETGSKLIVGDDARVLAVFGTPDKFDRHWRIAAAFPFLTRQTSVERSDDYDIERLDPDAQRKLAAQHHELASLLVANLVLPIPEGEAGGRLDERRAKDALLRARDLLEDSDVAQKRRAFHSWVARYESKDLPDRRKVQEFDELLTDYNDAARRKRKARTVERSVLVLRGATAGASMFASELSPAGGPVGIIGTVATSQLYQQREWQSGDIRAAALISEARKKIHS